ncbi:hypothetical protein MKW92_002805 [Papaver armeniacum]|nr:hypothetical protein MKW92_002805 [Papaver armeniacum]
MMTSSNSNSNNPPFFEYDNPKVAPCLPLPSLPVFCGALDQELRLYDETTTAAIVNRSANRNDVLAQATKIADLLRHTDVSYLNLREGVSSLSRSSTEPSSLYHQVLKYDSEAFEYSIPGLIKERNHSSLRPEKKTVEQNEPSTSQRKHEGALNHQSGGNRADGAQASVSSRRQKVKKKGHDDVSLTQPDPSEVQDGIIRGYTERLEELCSRAETLNEDQDETDAQLLSSTDLKLLVNDTMTIRGKKILHLVPLDIFVRLLSVLDLQIRAAEGVSLDENEDGDSDAMSLVICALESIHAALAVMTHPDMPKQLYKEEVIERVLDFSRHQIMESMCACDPSYRALHKPNETTLMMVKKMKKKMLNLVHLTRKDVVVKVLKEGGQLETSGLTTVTFISKFVRILYYDLLCVDLSQLSSNLTLLPYIMVAAAVNAVLQKLCTILGFLRDLLSIERLPDSCILQLIKTSFSTFLVDNCQLLQLKAIGLICGVFSSYPQHRSYLIDETVQLLWKLPFSKRALRTYLLPDEEQRQIQMITALLIQLVQSSANLPVILRQALTVDSISDASVDVCYPTKCNEASTEACCLFWTRVLQRLTTVKTQDASEVKVIIENIVMDLLSTLNLPEYPASAPILEVINLISKDCMGVTERDAPSRVGVVIFAWERSSGQQLLLNYMQGAGLTDDAHLYARWFYLCLWYKDDPKSQEKLAYYLARLQGTSTVVSSFLTRESSKKNIPSLWAEKFFSREFDKILCMLLASLRENSPVIRAKALRAVSLIVEADPEVLCEKRVQSAVEGRFCDSAISVREAALELVGRHIASHPDVVLKDTGVSVRKRAIKIIRDMCTSNANFSEFTSACHHIISRVSDEESSIQTESGRILVCKTFYDFWFEEPSRAQTQFAGDGSSIVEMLRKMSNHQQLVTILKRNLALDFFPQSAKAAGISPMSLAMVRKRCELICKCLLERILQVEQTDNGEVEVHALPYVLVLHSFCMVDPTLCSPASDPSQFVVTLQPYLKTQVFMLTKQNNAKGGTLIEYLIQVFLKRLDTLGDDAKQQVGRSLFCLGLLIRYGSKLMVTSDNKIILFDKSLSSLMSYLCSEDFVIRVRALQKLGRSLEATLAPGSDDRLKMQALQNVCEYLLDSESEMGTDKTTSSTTTQYADAAQNVPVAAGAGDMNICGGIVQLYWDSILKVCLDMNEQVRQSAVKIVEVLLRQGLVHPITCVPHLIALETDPQEVNSKLAHHLLTNMNENHPQMSFFFIQSMTLHSVEYPKEKGSGIIKGKADGNSFNLVRLGVSRVYRLIRGNHISRNKFMYSIVHKFEPASCSISLKEAFIPFLNTEILASLPFVTPDEPLYLIYSINRVIQVKAGALEANLKALISRLMETGILTTPLENGRIQQDAAPSPVSSNITTEDSERHSSTSSDTGGLIENDMQNIQVDCQTAIALQLLLKIKRQLKIIFNLDDARYRGENLPTTSEQFVERYQEFKAALKEDIMDYSMYTSNIKRKCPPARSSRGGRSGRETGYYDEEEDEDYDDGYAIAN